MHHGPEDLYPFDKPMPGPPSLWAVWAACGAFLSILLVVVFS